MTETRSEASFQCWFCEKNLTQHRYVIEDGFAVCLSCYDEKYSTTCRQCQEKIGIEMPGTRFQDQTWHQTCFRCSVCDSSLINTKFAYRNQSLYCSRCLIEEFAARCHRCNRPVEPGESYTDYEGKHYHPSCFICHGCQQPLKNFHFQRRDQYFLCSTCHLRLAAIYCIKCHQAIGKEGVLYHNHPFHSQCFRCTRCTLPLQNQRFVESNNDAYCAACSSVVMNKGTNVTSWARFNHRRAT